MYKFVLDADATIKLAKAGVLEKLADSSICMKPNQVYDEVMRGKEKMREDAFITEALVEKSKIKLVGEAKTDNDDAGAGERAALAVFKDKNADAVISDDSRFLTKLKKANVPFIAPANIVVWLAKNKVMTNEDALNSLERLRVNVRREAYERAKKLLEGQK